MNIKTTNQLCEYLLSPACTRRWERYAKGAAWGHTYFSDEVIDHAMNDLITEFITITTNNYLHPVEETKSGRKLEWTKRQICDSMLIRIKKAVAYHRKKTLDNHGSRRKLPLSEDIQIGYDMEKNLQDKILIEELLTDFDEREQILIWCRLVDEDSWTKIASENKELGKISTIKQLWYNSILPRLAALKKKELDNL